MNEVVAPGSGGRWRQGWRGRKRRDRRRAFPGAGRGSPASGPPRRAALISTGRATRPVRSISRERRFSRHAWPSQLSSQKTANSIAPSQAVCLETAKGLGVLVERVLESGISRYQLIDTFSQSNDFQPDQPRHAAFHDL